MSVDPSLRRQLAEAFHEEFPSSRIVEAESDMLVILTVVDYVPGCLPNCKKFRTYRNWNCEVISYASDTAMVFNMEGPSYNPFYNQASGCASQFSKVSGSAKRVQTPD